MKKRYKSMVFVNNECKLSVRKLRKLRVRALEVIHKIEEKADLPKRSVIDWTLTSTIWQRKGARDPILLVQADVYRIVRPRPEERSCAEYVFGILGHETLSLLTIDSDMFPGVEPEEAVVRKAIEIMEGEDW